MVRPPVLADELSLSCARLMAGRVTTLWVKCPLSVKQHGQLSLPSLRGRLNEYQPINDGLRRWRPDCCWLPLAGDRATARSLQCVQAVGGGLSGLAAQFSDESALEVCIHDYALYKSTVLTLTIFTACRNLCWLVNQTAMTKSHQHNS